MRPIKYILGCLMAVVISVVATGNIQDENPEVVKTEVTKIPYKVQYQFDRSLGPGRAEKVQFGVDGYVKKTVRYTKKDGKLVNPVLVNTEKVDPKNAIINIGEAGWESTRGSYERVKVMTMQSSAYTRFENTNRTALGLPAKYGVVAVDRRVIKLGTRLYIEGYGYAIAGDTGGAIKGNRIDLCMDKYSDAIKWGRRPVTVHILK